MWYRSGRHLQEGRMAVVRHTRAAVQRRPAVGGVPLVHLHPTLLDQELHCRQLAVVHHKVQQRSRATVQGGEPPALAGGLDLFEAGDVAKAQRVHILHTVKPRCRAPWQCWGCRHWLCSRHGSHVGGPAVIKSPACHWASNRAAASASPRRRCKHSWAVPHTRCLARCSQQWPAGSSTAAAAHVGGPTDVAHVSWAPKPCLLSYTSCLHLPQAIFF